MGQGRQFVGGEGAVVEAGTIELAVVGGGYGAGALRWAGGEGGEEQGAAGRRRDVDRRRVVCGQGAVGGNGPASQGLLDEDDAAAGGVIAGADEGPDALMERRAGGGLDGRVLAVGQVEAEVAVGTDDQGEALGGGVVGPAR